MRSITLFNPPLHLVVMIVPVQNLHVRLVLALDDQRRAFLRIVVAAFPVLLAPPSPVAEEAHAVDEQQLAAVLLRRHVRDGVGAGPWTRIRRRRGACLTGRVRVGC